MKKLVFTLLTILTIASLSACSGEENSKGGNTSSSTPKVPSQIVLNYSDETEVNRYEFIFEEGGVGVLKNYEKYHASGHIDKYESQFSYYLYPNFLSIDISGSLRWHNPDKSITHAERHFYYVDGYLYHSSEAAAHRAYGNGKKVEVSW